MTESPDPSDPDFAPFWAGTLVSELRVQRCTQCGTVRWPPRPMCPACRSFHVGWVTATPHGSLYSWTEIGHQTVPGRPTPYTVVLVELDKPAGVRLLGNLTSGSSTGLRAGMPMTARFDLASDHTYALVNWTPDDSHDAGPATEVS